MFLLCRLLSRICEYLLLRAGDAASVEMAQASPSSHAKMPVAPVMANLQPASGARPSRQGGAMREFYWAEDVHKMLDMTNASLKDMARAGQSSHAMISELTDQVEEMKKVNALLMEELKLEGDKRGELEKKVAELEAKSGSAESSEAQEMDAKRAALEARAQEVEEQCRAALELQAAIAEERQALDVDRHYLEQEVLAQQEIAAELHEVMANYCRYEEEVSQGSVEPAVRPASMDNTMSDGSFHDAASGSHDADAALDAASPDAEHIVRALHSRLNTIACKWKEAADPSSPLGVARAHMLRSISGDGASSANPAGEAREDDFSTP
eukprot:jgi/Tetstr1/439758/TSEL_028172.t1